ncbi:hypothetical protein VP018_003064 [Morganella morganii]|nr:hypothetical protein [Morganella morganii]
MKDFSKYKKTLNQLDYYVYALCEIKENLRIPFYIGKGKNSRCLTHISDAMSEVADNAEDISNEKLKRIKELYEEDRLGIDILCHGLNSETAFMVETTCIDLIGIKGLTNKINGKKSPGNDIYKTQGRLTIEEAASWYSGEPTEVSKEDKGLVFILNKLYRFDMTEQELFEATRGVWHNPPRNDESLKYAYAVYNNIVKEVYEIHGWIKAGTQEYFTRKIGRDSDRWEFIGRKAEQSIRDKYVGKIINYDRSYGTPFVKVGNTPAGK